MTSDFWVGRYVKVHLMISDVGRWVGQRGSDVRSVIFEVLVFRLKVHCQTYFLNFATSKGELIYKNHIMMDIAS